MTVAALRQRPAWTALEAHHQKIKGLQLRQLFAERREDVFWQGERDGARGPVELPGPSAPWGDGGESDRQDDFYVLCIQIFDFQYRNTRRQGPSADRRVMTTCRQPGRKRLFAIDPSSPRSV